MPVLRIEPDPETFSRLSEDALRERRPIAWQAEVLIRRALGLEPLAPACRGLVAPCQGADTEVVDAVQD